MTYYFSADPHAGHTNILKYCNRPFATIEEHDEELIRQWNLTVGDNDTAYILGDVTLGSDADKYLCRLAGKIRIIPGGHDWRWLKAGQPFQEHMSSRNWSEKINILSPLETLTIKRKGRGKLIVVCAHWSMRVWDRSHHNSIHFYGHSHGNLPVWPNSLDVGVDNAKKLLGTYRPFSLDEAVKFSRSYK